MVLTPHRIYDNFLDKKIDQHSAYEQLSSIIEESDKEKDRVEAFKFLNNIGVHDQCFLNLLENHLISDNSEDVRIITIEILGQKFLEVSTKIVQWAFINETSNKCLNILYKTLLVQIRSLSNELSNKPLLIADIHRIKETELIIRSEYLNSLSVVELKEILINSYTLSLLKRSFWRLKYKIQNNLIVELDFTFKELTAVPEPIKNLTSLNKLILKYNQIMAIPPWINQLKSLKCLDLSHNSINALRKSLFSLEWLECLFLEYNIITKVPDVIIQLHSLQYLNLKGNPLSFVSKNVYKLPSLKELHLSAVPKSTQYNKHENKDLKIFYDKI
ncbi:MAG: leucine-rich repeat domain-containing protein [Candidatus Lokiarchaeota archaeon]|nr:leucine-rich repeat domain-containing protein [Candidatus Lokiarchaeota archaeon]